MKRRKLRRKRHDFNERFFLAHKSRKALAFHARESKHFGRQTCGNLVKTVNHPDAITCVWDLFSCFDADSKHLTLGPRLRYWSLCRAHGLTKGVGSELLLVSPETLWHPHIPVRRIPSSCVFARRLAFCRKWHYEIWSSAAELGGRVARAPPTFCQL